MGVPAEPFERLRTRPRPPLPHRARSRPRGDGHRLPRPRPQARPAGRREGPAARAGGQPSARSAFSARSGSPPCSPTPTSFRCSTPARPTASSTTSCRTWRASRCGTGWSASVSCPSRRPSASRSEVADGARATRTATAWCTATSSRRTSCFMGGHAVVADFGIARAVGRGRGARGSPQTGLALGTPAYMSPGAGRRAGRAWTAGATSTRSAACCTRCSPGEPPFTGPTAQAVLARKLTSPRRGCRPCGRPCRPHWTRPSRRAAGQGPGGPFRHLGRASPRPRLQPETQDPLGPGRTAPGTPWSASRPPGGRGSRWPLGARCWRAAASPAAGDGLADRRPRPTMAVLPFENLGPADDDYFAAGMTDEITTRLGAVSGLGVVAASRGPAVCAAPTRRVREIGRELGVDYRPGRQRALGRRDSGSRSVRITLELLRAEDERQLWSTTYDRVIDDIFDVQSDIAAQVVDRLGVTLGRGRTQPAERPADRESRGLHAVSEGPVLLEQAHGGGHPDRARLLPAGGRPGSRLFPAPGSASPTPGSFAAGTASWRRARRFPKAKHAR